MKYIKSAIDSLCLCDDVVAKEAVANLGIVYFDLSE